MTWFDVLLSIVLLSFAYIVKRGIDAAYRNGCNDGYGFSKEPNNPGYREAGKILLKRWPEIQRRIREEKPVDWE